uniref:C-type lectin domain-containing protein n=1 Tax=Oryzias sinensis TaxID=183150 RepID=A0A8C7X0W9_9TELE
SIRYLSLSPTGTQQNPEYVFVNERMNWSSAQRHCGHNFTDLATVRNDTDWQKIYSVVPTYQNTWMGLYRNSNIFWSDGTDTDAEARRSKQSLVRIIFPSSDYFPTEYIFPKSSDCPVRGSVSASLTGGMCSSE